MNISSMRCLQSAPCCLSRCCAAISLTCAKRKSCRPAGWSIHKQGVCRPGAWRFGFLNRLRAAGRGSRSESVLRWSGHSAEKAAEKAEKTAKGGNVFLFIKSRIHSRASTSWMLTFGTGIIISRFTFEQEGLVFLRIVCFAGQSLCSELYCRHCVGL